MDKTETLKACPFCGGEAELYEGHRDHWKVRCKECHSLRGNWFKDDKAEAIAAWNTRAPRPDNALADDAVERAAELRDVVMPVISACLLMRSDDPKLAHPRLGVAAEVANAVAKHLSAIRSTPPEADLRAENEDTISVSGLLDWIEQAWPEGSGSNFNQGVVRGFEIIRAQLQEGYIQRYCAALSALTPSLSVDAVERQFFERNWFVARVAEDCSEVAIDHPTDADWFAIRRAHEVLRDRLNERLGAQQDCPIRPPASDAVDLLREAREALLPFAEAFRLANSNDTIGSYFTVAPFAAASQIYDRIDAALKEAK